jgi:hypothetical protein
LSKNKFKTNLLSKALDKDDQEIGRANVEVEFAENDAKYINFIFPKELDMQLVKRFKISIKE